MHINKIFYLMLPWCAQLVMAALWMVLLEPFPMMCLELYEKN